MFTKNTYVGVQLDAIKMPEASGLFFERQMQLAIWRMFLLKQKLSQKNYSVLCLDKHLQSMNFSVEHISTIHNEAIEEGANSSRASELRNLWNV